jgi:nicotinamide riboside kinase
MPESLRIAIVGAESTGKTSLAVALRARLAAGAGLRVALVGEVLREWCDAHGRTPAAHEQRAIAEEQHRRIEAAAVAHEIVVSDTTALMTSVYSQHCFGDRSLEPFAVHAHRSVTATLLMAIDLPWQADGFQRDGEHVREPVDALLRELLCGNALPFAVIAGRGEQRLEQALLALRRPLSALGAAAAPLQALFSGLVTPDATPGAQPRPGGWRCECCVPGAERATRQRPNTAATG